MVARIFCVIALLSSLVFPQHHESSSSVTPSSALSMLQEGNKRFSEGLRDRPNQNEERRIETARNGQKPFASILSCADSRVPLEHIFDAGIGDLFVVRVAGNIADPSQIGSLEYGVGHLGTPVLMVLGHSKCGAVTAVVTKAQVGGSIPSFTDNIEPAAAKVRTQNPGALQDDLVNKAIKANVWQAVEDIFRTSEEIRALVRQNRLKVVGALYDLESGKVSNLGVHFRQSQLIAESGMRTRSKAAEAPGH